MAKIKQIEFPNNVSGEDIMCYTTDGGCEIKEIYKNGEMSMITWFEISKDGKKIAEIKESVCNIYFN